MHFILQIDDEIIAENAYVQQFWNIEKKRQLRTAPRLTEYHVYPKGKQKMKVKYATQLLSHSTATGKENSMNQT